MAWYCYKSGPVKWQSKYVMPINEVEKESDELSEYIGKAKDLLNQKKTISQICEIMGTSASTLKSRLNKHGIEYGEAKRKAPTSLFDKLKFEEVDEFRAWLDENGVRTSDSSCTLTLFNAYVPHCRKVKIVYPSYGPRYVSMPSGLIGHYKQWKGIA